MRKLLNILIIATLFTSCKRGVNIPPGVSNIPLITDLDVSSQEFDFLDTAGRSNIRFTIWDQDKDFGYRQPDSTAVTIQDIRSDTVYRTLKLPMPEIPREILDKDYLQANVTIPLKSVLFTPRSDSIHIKTRKDTLVMKIWVKDEAGNESNILDTDTFYIFD